MIVAFLFCRDLMPRRIPACRACAPACRAPARKSAEARAHEPVSVRYCRCKFLVRSNLGGAISFEESRFLQLSFLVDQY